MATIVRINRSIASRPDRHSHGLPPASWQSPLRHALLAQAPDFVGLYARLAALIDPRLGSIDALYLPFPPQVCSRTRRRRPASTGTPCPPQCWCRWAARSPSDGRPPRATRARCFGGRAGFAAVDARDNQCVARAKELQQRVQLAASPAVPRRSASVGGVRIRATITRRIGFRTRFCRPA